MKTLGRILIILIAFALVMGATYTIVSASSSNSVANAPAFERDNGGRPEFQGGERPEGLRDRDGGFGPGVLLGAVKNIGIVAVIVTLIVIPKNRLQKKKRELSATA